MEIELLEEIAKFFYDHKDDSTDLENLYDAFDDYITEEIELVETHTVSTRLKITKGEIELYDVANSEPMDQIGYFHNELHDYLYDLDLDQVLSDFLLWTKKELPESYSKEMERFINNIITGIFIFQ